VLDYDVSATATVIHDQNELHGVAMINLYLTINLAIFEPN
jgi:hypothetical protein